MTSVDPRQVFCPSDADEVRVYSAQSAESGCSQSFTLRPAVCFGFTAGHACAAAFVYPVLAAEKEACPAGSRPFSAMSSERVA